MVAALRGRSPTRICTVCSLGFHSRARVGDLLYRVTADTLAMSGPDDELACFPP